MLGPCSPISERGLQYLSSIFNRHNSWLWDYVIDTRDLCCSVPANYKKVCQAIQGKFEYQLKSWQVAVIMDIVYGKIDVIVSARIRKSKSLIYQAVSLINSRAIILIIIPIITFMKDQERELRQKSVSVLVLTAVIVKADLNI